MSKTETVIVHAGSEMTKLMQDDYCDRYKILDLSNVNFFIRLLRKFTYKIFPTLWIKFFYKGVCRDDIKTIILFDSLQNNFWVKGIKQHFPHSKIIFWLWNTILDQDVLDNIIKFSDEVYTFDSEQSFKNNIQFHPQFLPFDHKKYFFTNKEVSGGIVFVGSDKGRLNELHSIGGLLKKESIPFSFHVMTDINISSMQGFYQLNNNISYSSLIQLYLSSSCILEVCKEGQSGLTLRPIEAMFMRRKIITNNSSISGYDFFNPSNIYILGHDSRQLSYFLSEPFVDIPNHISEKYSFEHWVKKLTRNVV